MEMGLNYTKTNLHEGDFAPMIDFARVIFLHESKKYTKKNR